MLAYGMYPVGHNMFGSLVPNINVIQCCKTRMLNMDVPSGIRAQSKSNVHNAALCNVLWYP